MTRVAPLSYTSHFGNSSYYGLRVNPTFEQLVGTTRKEYRIPLPSRLAKWYANSPYRALILDAERKYQDYEHASIDYKQSGAHLPEAAARVRSSDAANDPAWDEIPRHHERMEAHDAYEAAFEAMNAEHREREAVQRRQTLHQMYGANGMHPVIEAEHSELDEADVPHNMPAPRPAPPRQSYRAPPKAFVAAGQPQAPEFPSFERLNMREPARFAEARISPSEARTYERLREDARPSNSF
jgi:hypothetical protein